MSPAALPDHLRAAGEFKGTIKDVELADAVTFRVVMTTGKLFEAKVRSGGACQSRSCSVVVYKFVYIFRYRR